MEYITQYQLVYATIWVIFTELLLNLVRISKFIYRNAIKLKIVKSNISFIRELLNVGFRRATFVHIWMMYGLTDLTGLLICVKHYRYLKSKRVKQRKKNTLSYFIKKSLHKVIKTSTLKLRKQKVNYNPILKPNLSYVKKIELLNKKFIRQSRFFNKTKYSFIRQECKNIVHLTLLINAVFIYIVISMYFKWYIPSQVLFVFYIFTVLWCLPIIKRIPIIIDYYRKFLDY